MDSNAGGWGSVVLPNTAPPIGSVLQSAIAQKQQEAMMGYRYGFQKDRLAEQQKRQEQEMALKKQKFLQDLFKPGDMQTGVSKITQIGLKATQDLKEELFAKAPNMPIEELEAEASAKFNPIMSSIALAKDKIKAETERITDYAKNHKNFDLSSAIQDLHLKIGGMFIEPTEEGKINFKPIDHVNVAEDVAGGILNPENRWKYALDSDYLGKEIANTKGDARTYLYHDPKTLVDTQFTGYLPSWAEESVKGDERGIVSERPLFKLKTKRINSFDSSGKPVNIEYFDDNEQHAILNSEDKQDSFNKWYNEVKKPKQANLNAVDKEVLKGAALAEYVRQFDQNQPRPTDWRHPQKFEIYPNGTGGSKSGGGEEMINAFGEISRKVKGDMDAGHDYTRINSLSSTSQAALLKTIREISGGKGIDPITGATIPLGNGDIYLKPTPDGQVLAMRKLGDQPSPSDQVITPLNEIGVNIKANQPLGVKAQRQVIKRANSDKGKTQSTPSKSSSKGFVPHKM